MKKDKLGAFIDAVYAITITICIINLEKPADVTWEAFWAIKNSLIVYTITFFMMVSMWIQIHYLWEQIERIDHGVIWTCMIFLFTSSFIPYMTSLLVGDNFSNKYFAVAYGLLAIIISLNLLVIQKTAEHCNKDVLTAKYNKSIIMPNVRIMIVDILIKVVGTIISVLVWPPTILIAVVISFEYNSIATRVVLKRMHDETLFDKQKRIELRRQRALAIKQKILDNKQKREEKKQLRVQGIKSQIKQNVTDKNKSKQLKQQEFMSYLKDSQNAKSQSKNNSNKSKKR